MAQNRQLSAIMFTDIQGYTSLMQQDEKGALQLRERHREIFEASTKKYNGKIVQYFGDGTLSVFKSTVEAINCGIEMQLAFLEKPKIPLRIGIHVGDIVYSKEDIIGDAVNIASRIESIAVPGSILISNKVYDQIRNQKQISAKFLDAFDLKNVKEAVPVFAISNPGIVIPDPKKIKEELRNQSKLVTKTKNHNKKYLLLVSVVIILALLTFLYKYNFSKSNLATTNSIAVLPFDNLSTDEDSDIFTDGITEDILTNLSKLKDLHVISRTSVMHYKNSDKKIPQIAKELGVSYILEGSIRKYGDQVRVTAQLINAESDKHLWAQNYDKTLTDIFAIQTEVSKEIVNALELNITFDEQQSLATIPTNNIEAYKLFLTGRQEADKRTKESIAKSIELYQKAIALDQNYAEAYAEIANSIYLGTYYSGRDPKQASAEAKTYLAKAEAINNKISRIYTVKGLIYNIDREYDKAQEAFEMAVKLSPNDVTARHQFATYYYYTKQYEKQLEQAEIAYRLDPLSFATGNSYFTALIANDKYEEAKYLMMEIEKTSDENNQFVINRSYFRLYMQQKDYESAIAPLIKLSESEPVYYRFLGFCYGYIGDTLNAYKAIKAIREKGRKEEINYMTSVVFAGLKQRDSVLYYLDTSRNRQTRMLRREKDDFFDFLKDDPEFIQLLKTHGLTPLSKEKN